MRLIQPYRRLAASFALLALCACSPAAQAPAPEPEPSKREAGGPAAPVEANEPAQTAPRESARAAPERAVASSARRCGWLHNPTPANWWLVDRDGRWILAAQGGHQAPGMDAMPDMSAGEWVKTNGHYGHGCACMTIVADPASGHVTKVSDATSKPLAQCRADKKLPDPAE